MTKSRRTFLKNSAIAMAGCSTCSLATRTGYAEPGAGRDPIIDIHQHTNYSGRTDAQMLEHQKTMGISRTILLPAGTPMELASTHKGRSQEV